MSEKHLSSEMIQVAELLSSGESVTDTAASVGVTRQTIYRWQKESAQFVALLNRLRNEQIHAARNRIRANATKAIDVIASIMENSQNDATRLQAARELLTMSGILTNLENGFVDDADDIESGFAIERKIKSLGSVF